MIAAPEVTPVAEIPACVAVIPHWKVELGSALEETLHLSARVLMVPFGITSGLSNVNVGVTADVVAVVDGFTMLLPPLRAVVPSKS